MRTHCITAGVMLVCVCVLMVLQMPVADAKKPTGSFIFGSLPEEKSADSTRYKRYLKLTRLGYEGGEVERALSEEHGDLDQASYRLSRDYSGFHGLHCLSRGNCFGDARRTVFREPADKSVVAVPPRLQELPELSPEEQARRLAAGPVADSNRPQPKKPAAGVDFSKQILEKQLPKLDPFQRISHPPTEIPHDRAVSEIRRDRGPTEHMDEFTSLMRSWITTIRAPWHTKKPGSMHESEADNPSLPKDTHPIIVPGIMEKSADGKKVISQYYQPEHYATHKLAELEAKQQKEKEDADRIALNRQHIVLDGRGGYKNTLPPPPPPAEEPTPAPEDASEGSADSAELSPAEQQEQELVAAQTEGAGGGADATSFIRF